MAKDFKICLLFEFYKGVLTEKQQEAFVNYYYDDLSLSEISENTGITRQGARDAIKRSEEILLDMEEKLGLSAKMEQKADAFRQIGAWAKEAENALMSGDRDALIAHLNEIRQLSERMNEDGI